MTTQLLKRLPSVGFLLGGGKGVSFDECLANGLAEMFAKISKFTRKRHKQITKFQRSSPECLDERASNHASKFQVENRKLGIPKPEFCVSYRNSITFCTGDFCARDISW